MNRRKFFATSVGAFFASKLGVADPPLPFDFTSNILTEFSYSSPDIEEFNRFLEAALSHSLPVPPQNILAVPAHFRRLLEEYTNARR